MTRAYICNGCGEAHRKDDSEPFRVNRGTENGWKEGDFCPDCFPEEVSEDNLETEVK